MGTNCRFKEEPLSLISVSRKNVGIFIASLCSLTCHAQAYSVDSQSQSCGWTVSADFLAWYASQEEASIWADVITSDEITSTWGAPGFNFKWDAGFRLGLQRNLGCDNWDTAIYWTWFQTSHHQTIPFVDQSAGGIGPEFFAAFLSGDNPRRMSGSWNLLFNTLDWELGRSFWVCENFSIRPFMGLKAGWIDQSIKVQYQDLILFSSIPTSFEGNEQLKNDFFGLGPQFGFYSKWRFGSLGSHSFYLLGDFSLATLYGKWSCSDFYSNELGQATSVIAKDSMLGSLTFRGFLGLECQLFSCCEGPEWKVRLGYEAQMWMNQLRFSTFQLQRLHNDLTLQGVTLSCVCSF